MKEQHPRGLTAKNKHSKALMTPYNFIIEILLNLTQFTTLGTKVKFRRICMEAEPKGTSISETICPTMLVFGRYAFQMFFF